MAETSIPHEAERQRVFISYSRADRQRVAGLAAPLEALGHDVFMDQRSILPGGRWKEKLEEGLQAADVLLVFWTRHAKQSDWVRWEYESFDTQFPDRPLVPVLGDRTPLTERLQARQYSDFCPLLNELFATVRDLKEKGVGKRKIRAAVLKCLQEEGIELPRDKRNLLFGLFGIPGWAMVPLYFLHRGRDRLADEMAQKIATLPAASYYSAGAAVAAGFITCHALFGSGGIERPFIEVIEKIKAEAATEHITVTEVIDRIIRHYDEGKDRQAKRLLMPDLFPVAVHLDQSGNDACDSQGMICVSMSRAPIHDMNLKFFGYTTPTCSARVIRESACSRAFKVDYALKGVVLRRSPEEGVQDLSRRDFFCMEDEARKQGIYQFANCVKP
jgi:hypothetical protein